MVYKTSGVCSSAISFEIDDAGKVHNVKFPMIWRTIPVSMRHRESKSRKLLFLRKQAEPHVHSRSWLPWDSALCLLSERTKACRTKTWSVSAEIYSRCVTSGTEMISPDV